jgi:hypothetical protein
MMAHERRMERGQMERDMTLSPQQQALLRQQAMQQQAVRMNPENQTFPDTNASVEPGDSAAFNLSSEAFGAANAARNPVMNISQEVNANATNQHRNEVFDVDAAAMRFGNIDTDVMAIGNIGSYMGMGAPARSVRVRRR